MTARDVLAEIEQRADLAKRDESLIWLGDHDEALKLAIPEARERLIEKDAPAMVAALRAVLDLHQQMDVAVSCSSWEPPTYAMTCRTCHIPGLPQWPCAEYRAITDALNGTAGTDR